MDKALYETGAKIRREVLGDAAVERSAKAQNAFTRPFMQFMIEYCWGGVWGQPVLSRKQRSLNNLCMLSALNRPEEFKLHVKGALNNGCSLDEIAETLMQVTVYCGVPAGVNAFRLAREVFEAEGIKIPE